MRIHDRNPLDSADTLRSRLAWAAHSSAAMVSPRRGADGTPDPLVLVHVPARSMSEVRRVLAGAQVASEGRYLLTGRHGSVEFRLWRTPSVHEVARLFASALIESPAAPGDASGLTSLAEAVALQALSGTFGQPVEPTSAAVETVASLLASAPTVSSLRLAGDSPAAHVRLVTSSVASVFSADDEIQRLTLALRAPRAVTIHRQPVPVASDAPAVSATL